MGSSLCKTSCLGEAWKYLYGEIERDIQGGSMHGAEFPRECIVNYKPEKWLFQWQNRNRHQQEQFRQDAGIMKDVTAHSANLRPILLKCAIDLRYFQAGT